MCGIAGIITPNPNNRHKEVIERMTATLAHRGPDGEGYWTDEHHVAFGHRRLAIIDLTEAASQPMHYLNRYTIVYNGEIYNYKEIREDLIKQGYNFKSTSDTEVILAAYDCYKERCSGYFDGMFAFAIWDNEEQKLFAARDRFGEKPFYYSPGTNVFVFASEMKALWAYGIERTPNDRMILNYITLGYVQNPANKAQTFFNNIYSLPPAHQLTLDIKDYRLHIYAYYDIDKQTIRPLPEQDVLKYMDAFLRTSVKMRLRSDVPTGSSLSGGLDSSTLSWYIHSIKGSRIKEHPFFSAVFPGFEKDESNYIQAVTKHFNATSYQVMPDASDLIGSFEKLMYHQEEPFPSSSIFAQYKVYELAKQHGVKVLLDGQGADEVFGGYHKYLHWYLQEILSRHRFGKFRKERSAFQRNNIKVSWNYKNTIAAFLPSHVAIVLEKAEYRRIINHPYITKDFLSCTSGGAWEGVHKPIITKLNDILYFNTMQLGLEELLRFADRNSMSQGIEVRLPFLQTDMVEFLFSLPTDMKINYGFTKYILRKLMDKKLPDNIVWRTDKVGFEPPQKKWMQDPLLQDYMYHAKEQLVQLNILKPAVLQKNISPKDAHTANNFDWRYLCIARLLQTKL